MTKKVKICFLILIWGIVALQLYVNSRDPISLRQNAVFPSLSGIEQQEQDKVITAFSVAKKDKLEKNIKGFGYLGTMEVSEKNKKQILQQIAKKLDIKENNTVDISQFDNYTKYSLTQEKGENTTKIEWITMQENTEKPEQYLSMDVVMHDSEEKARELYETVIALYKDMDVEANVFMECLLKQKGNLEKNNATRLEFEKNMLAEKKATQICKMDTKDFHTTYAYTETDGNYYNLNGQKVNMQIVYSYCEEEDMTYIKVGYPIVNSSY